MEKNCYNQLLHAKNLKKYLECCILQEFKQTVKKNDSL